MGGCASAEAPKKAAAQDPALPAKPPKPSSMRLPAPINPAGNLVVSGDAPVAPPKPKALQGKDSIAAKKEKGDYRGGDDGKDVVAMIGPNKGATCITVPSAREEVSKDGSEKYYVYIVNVKLLGGKVHTITQRFSNFATFHKDWQKDYPGVNIEMPKKQMGSMSDEDIARRCVELQVYLRELCEVSALIYPVAKFLGIPETDLKAAIKGKSTSSAEPVAPARPSSNGSAQPKLPKIALAATQSDSDRFSTEKPKLPKVKLGDIDNGSSTPKSSTPPPSAPTPKALPVEPARKDEPVPPPPPKVEPVKAEPPPPPASRPISTATSSPSTPSKTVTPATPKSGPSTTPTKTTPTPAANNVVKGADSSTKANTAINSGGEKVMSVKERMAAFQKSGK